MRVRIAAARKAFRQEGHEIPVPILIGHLHGLARVNHLLCQTLLFHAHELLHALALPCALLGPLMPPTETLIPHQTLGHCLSKQTAQHRLGLVRRLVLRRQS